MTNSYRIRLCVQIGRALNSPNTVENVEVSGRTVTIKSELRDQPLSEATWVTLGAGGLASDAEARVFGEMLRTKVELAAMAARLGVDGGIDETKTWVSEEFALELGLIAPGDRLLPNVHGLSIMPDDEKNRVPSGSPTLTVRADPSHFINALSELPNELPSTLVASNGIKLLNLALMTNEPLAQIVLAFAAVEELGQDEDWSPEQRRLLSELESSIRDSATGAEHLEIADALRRSLHRVGLRQGVMRVFSRLGLEELRKDWDRLYGLRSGLFHGTARLTKKEVSDLAMQTVTLCGRVLLKQLRNEGIQPPTISSVHYPD